MAVQSSRDAGNRKYVLCTISTSQLIDPQFDASAGQTTRPLKPAGMRYAHGLCWNMRFTGALLSSSLVISADHVLHMSLSVSSQFGWGAAMGEMMCRSISYLYHQDSCELSLVSRESHYIFLFFSLRENPTEKKKEKEKKRESPGSSEIWRN